MRKKVSILGSIFLLLFGFSYVVPDVAQAVPAFARQTGLSCSTCHFQHFPALNAFGRAFKSGGYTMVGGQSMVEGDMLSIPSVLNASLVAKIRYQKTNGDYYYVHADDTKDLSSSKNDADKEAGTLPTKTSGKIDTNMGALQFPDEASLFLGGRVGENIGFLLEGQLIDPDGPFFASFKMPFIYDIAGTKLGVIPFSTDALGAAFGFELLNTGAVRNVRTIEHRKDISAQQFIGTDGAAEGIAFVAARGDGFVNATLWTPDHGTVGINSTAYYLRAAVTPAVIPGWDIGAGIQYWGGTASRDVNADPAGDIDTKAMAIDAQAQGGVGSMPLGIYVSYGSADKSTTSETNLFNSEPTGDKTALSISAELGVVPNKLSLGGGYRIGDNGKSSKNEDNALVIAATYYLVQNAYLQLDYSTYSGDKYDTKPAGGDQLTTLMLFTSF